MRVGDEGVGGEPLGDGVVEVGWHGVFGSAKGEGRGEEEVVLGGGDEAVAVQVRWFSKEDHDGSASWSTESYALSLGTNET